MEANTYPKNLEGFILLEKLKEQQALKKQQKKEDKEFDQSFGQIDSYDYMEPIPL